MDWDTAVIWPDLRYDYGEERMAGLGLIDGNLFYVAFVEREAADRIIRLRPAKKNAAPEVSQYVRYIEGR